MPRGGARVGAGRKPKKARVLPMPPAQQQTRGTQLPAAADSDLIEAPDHLPQPERDVWNRYAPLAVANGTLKDQTAPGFEFLCQLVVMHQELRKVIDAEGWQIKEPMFDSKGEHVGDIVKRHALWPQLQAFALRREQALRSYGLLALAKPVGAAGGKPTAMPRANPWSSIGVSGGAAQA